MLHYQYQPALHSAYMAELGGELYHAPHARGYQKQQLPKRISHLAGHRGIEGIIQQSDTLLVCRYKKSGALRLAQSYSMQLVIDLLRVCTCKS